MKKTNSFLNKEITWIFVIILSVITAAVVAVLNCIPALEGSSFTMPATTIELWIVLALFILLNCKNYKDAALKTFVFFLISQPLIYLIEVPFKTPGWGLFQNYPRWGLMTVLTLPGAVIAYRVKKGDLISAIILSVANVALVLMGFKHMQTVVAYFPRLILAALFCFIMPVVFTMVLLKGKNAKITAALLIAIAVAVGAILLVRNTGATAKTCALPEGAWTDISVSGEGIDAALTEDGIKIVAKKNGDFVITITDENGNKAYYDVNVAGSNNWIDVSEPYYE